MNRWRYLFDMGYSMEQWSSGFVNIRPHGEGVPSKMRPAVAAELFHQTAATELRAVVAHTRNKEEPPQTASGPPLPVAMPCRGASGSSLFSSGPPAIPAQAPLAVAYGHPHAKAAPLIVKVFGHQRLPMGKTFAVPKASGRSLLTGRPVVRSLSGGG
ncbi:mfsd2ab [Symbiodinium pilosum]|uniref:Mfsd2ab protein n=1 Tax=Symbiodinium pilosum TaxID=2952 RepID=A0A812J329_SYMPI|nr:mfsd2ab [Symbiodinium pilosum]